MSEPLTAECGPSAATWRTVVSETLAGGPLAWTVPIAGAVLLLLFPMLSGDQYWITEIARIATLALVVSGLNLTFGYLGELQFAQIFTFALGCYVTMILAIRGLDEILILIPIGATAAAIGAVVVSLPAIRVSGWALALTSFFFVVSIPELVAVFPTYTGGLNGLVEIPAPRLFGSALGTTGLYEVTIVSTIIWFTFFRNVVTSRLGVVFRVLRHSPMLASSIGYSPPKLRATTYALAALPTGVAGCLYGFISLVVTPSIFDLTLGIGIVAASILGGTESTYGALIGATVIELGPERSLAFHEYAPIVYGLFLVLAAVSFRHGLAGWSRTATSWLSRIVLPAQASNSSLDSTPPTALALGRLAGVPLQTDSLSVAFGGVHALEDVSLTAYPGQVTCLIGANGSGKTTFLNVVCGYVRGDAGSTVRLGDIDISRGTAAEIARSGVARTFQTPMIPRGVSVVEVVESGSFMRSPHNLVSSVLRLTGYRRSRETDRLEALRMLSVIGLRELADAEASSLSLGNRRLIEVARALCARPGALLLDEPAAGLTVAELDHLAMVIRLASRAGATVVLIDHNVGFVSSIADITYVLHLGRLIASGSAPAVQQDSAVVESYLGPRVVDAREPESLRMPRSIAALAPAVNNDRQPGGSTLSVTDVRAGYGDLIVLQGVSIRPQSGTIEVVLGRNGAGKTTLLGAIAGVVHVRGGSLAVGERDITGLPPYRRAALGIALVQEGKRVFRERTVMENVLLGTFNQSQSRTDRTAWCKTVLEEFPVLLGRSQDLAGHLSGGQLQMLAIAQAIASRPRVLLLDEPSAGLAPAVVTEMFQRIRQLAAEGMTVVLVEQLAAQALGIADHVTVLNNGSVAASGVPAQFKNEAVLRDAYFGAGASDTIRLRDRSQPLLGTQSNGRCSRTARGEDSIADNHLLSTPDTLPKSAVIHEEAT